MENETEPVDSDSSAEEITIFTWLLTFLAWIVLGFCLALGWNITNNYFDKQRKPGSKSPWNTWFKNLELWTNKTNNKDNKNTTQEK